MELLNLSGFIIYISTWLVGPVWFKYEFINSFRPASHSEDQDNYKSEELPDTILGCHDLGN